MSPLHTTTPVAVAAASERPSGLNARSATSAGAVSGAPYLVCVLVSQSQTFSWFLLWPALATKRVGCGNLVSRSGSEFVLVDEPAE